MVPTRPAPVSPVLLDIAQSPHHEGPGVHALAGLVIGDHVQLLTPGGIPFWLQVTAIVSRQPEWNPITMGPLPGVLEGVPDEEPWPGLPFGRWDTIRFAACNILRIV